MTTPENLVLWNGFRRELTKVAFPEAMLRAAENALAASGRAAGGVAHGVGRVGAEALSGIPARMNMRGVNRARQVLLEQLGRLEEMSMKVRPPGQGMFQGRDAHQAALDAWAKGQELVGQRRQMLQQQLPMFEAEAQRLGEHIQSLRQQPWTTPLRPPARRPAYGR